MVAPMSLREGELTPAMYWPTVERVDASQGLRGPQVVVHFEFRDVGERQTEFRRDRPDGVLHQRVGDIAVLVDVDGPYALVGRGRPVEQHTFRALARRQSELCRQPRDQFVVLLRGPALAFEHPGDGHAHPSIGYSM